MKILPHIIRLSLLLLVVVTPWLFGGVWARVQWVLMLAVAILLAVDVIARFGEEDRPHLLPTAWLPLLVGIALGVFQLIPQSPSVASWLASGSANWRSEFLTSTSSDSLNHNAPGKDTEPPNQQARSPSDAHSAAPRTLYAVATREYLALLCLGAAVFVLASLYLVDRQSSLWFTTAAAVCGAAISFFGLVQRLSWNGKFYWVFEPLYGGFQSFGPFVNRNNAGGFLNLCLAAGLGLLIFTHWNRLEPSSQSSSSGRRRRHRARSGERSWSRSRSRHSAEAAAASSPSTEPRAEADEAAEETTFDGVSWTTDPVALNSGGTTSSQRPSGTSDAPPPANPSRPTSKETQRDDAHRESSRRRSQGRRSGRKSHRSASRSGQKLGRRLRSSYYSARPRPTLEELAAAIRRRAREYFGDLNAMRLWSVALVCIIAGGVLCTASRGSILAMFVAGMVTGAAFAVRRGNRGFAVGLVVVMLAGAGLMSWAGQTEYVQGRLASMLDESTYDTGRFPNWVEAINTVPKFWGAGTGLGTYRFVYERFQHRFTHDLAHYHAENQFIQALVEGGIVAFSLVLAAIFLTGAAVVRLYRTGGAVNTSLAAVGTFALISQIVGGSFDFGLYLPSNMLLMAALCGIVVGRAALLTVWSSHILDGSSGRLAFHTRRSSTGKQGPTGTDAELLSDKQRVVHGSTRSRRAFRARRTPPTDAPTPSLISLPAPVSVVTLIVGVLLLGCLFGSLEMNKAAKIELAMRATQMRDLREIDDPAFLTSIIGPLQATLPNRWDDALAHRRLAEVRMQLYRAETYQRLLAEQKSQANRTQDQDAAAESHADEDAQQREQERREQEQRDDELWQRSSIWHLNATLRQLDRQGDAASIAALLDQEAVKEHLIPAQRHVLLARQSAPTIPQLHYMLAELSVLNVKADDQIHLARARTLAPGDATMWYWTGLLDLNADRDEQACHSWRQSLLLSPRHLNDIMQSARGQLTIRQILDDVLPMHAELLLNAANDYFAGDQRSAIRNQFLQRAEESLSQTVLPPDRMAYVTAKIYRLQGRGEEAVPFYAAAVNLNSSTASWRYEYACLLRDLKRYDEALEQAIYMTSQWPKTRRFQRLYEEISSLRHRSGSST